MATERSNAAGRGAAALVLAAALLTVACGSARFAEAGRGVGAPDYARLRTEQASHLVSGPRAPLDSAGLERLAYFPPDARFRVMATRLPALDTADLRFPTSDGRTRLYRPAARLAFVVDGVADTLTLYRSVATAFAPAATELLFLPFRDATSGEQSYGGGRYLDFPAAVVGQETIDLDFNLAYNPYCAYATGYSCPVPPATNTLAVALLAGEMAPVESNRAH